MLDLPPNANNRQSEVSRYYTGRNVLVTGASGFMGLLLIERLLRCCPGIEKMYILMREKKGKTAEERFKEHFNNVIYDRLKQEQSDFITKVIMVEVDFSDGNLNLSSENRKCLLDTNIIFHLAATVRFNEKIRTAVNINVSGTEKMLLLAKEMPNLEAFVYVSTAFSNCVKNIIEEKHYPPPLKANDIVTLLNILDDKKLEEITPTLIGEWPNTYVYTKAIAEDAVLRYSVELPICIVRPSIVITTMEEPIPGWINNLYGPVGVTVGATLGLLRTLHCIPEHVAEVMPADYVTANIIVAGWDRAKKKGTLQSIENANTEVPETERTPIYNLVSSNKNPITWKSFMKYTEDYSFHLPSIHIQWYYTFTLHRYLFMHKLSVFFLHIIPAIIVDTFRLIVRRKPILLKGYKKINYFSDAISYFSMRQWQFHDDAVTRLWDRLNPVDREIFYFDIKNMSWEECMKRMVSGIRKHILKDLEDDAERAYKKCIRLFILHHTLLTIIYGLLVWAALILINFIVTLFL